MIEGRPSARAQDSTSTAARGRVRGRLSIYRGFFHVAQGEGRGREGGGEENIWCAECLCCRIRAGLNASYRVQAQVDLVRAIARVCGELRSAARFSETGTGGACAPLSEILPSRSHPLAPSG